MTSYHDEVEEIMYHSGFANTLSKLVSLRGPLKFRYKGKWYQPLYYLYTVWVEFVCFINLVTVGVKFFQPDIDVVERCFTGFPLFSLSLGFFRVTYLFFKRERFAKLINEYDSLYKGSPQLESDIRRNAKIIRIIPRFLILLTAAPMAPWCFMPIINSMMGGKWTLSVPAAWPFDPLQSLFTFITVTILQSFAAGYTCLRVVLFDNMFYCYACRQLALTTHLSRELTRILSTPVNVSSIGIPEYQTEGGQIISQGEASEILKKELRQWVLNHQKSLRLARELETLYSPSLLYQYAMISINLCTNAFVVVFSDTDLLNVFLCSLYVLGNSMELLITCRIGDFITEESKNLERATDNCHIYLFRDVYKTWLKMILIRARIPIKLSSLGIYTLSTATYKDIMVTTYSFFTLLKSMKERNDAIK